MPVANNTRDFKVLLSLFVFTHLTTNTAPEIMLGLGPGLGLNPLCALSLPVRLVPEPTSYILHTYFSTQTKTVCFYSVALSRLKSVSPTDRHTLNTCPLFLTHSFCCAWELMGDGTQNPSPNTDTECQAGGRWQPFWHKLHLV